jgi:hypothetical protein
MGVSVWCFLRAGSGELRPLAQRALDDFISGVGRLPPDAEGLVRFAEVVVMLDHRHAVEVLRKGFFQHHALRDGSLDQRRFKEYLAVIPEAALGGLRLPKPTPAVIPAEHTFAKRRLENLSHWKPTPADHAALRELVNRKAGRELL